MVTTLKLVSPVVRAGEVDKLVRDYGRRSGREDEWKGSRRNVRRCKELSASDLSLKTVNIDLLNLKVSD